MISLVADIELLESPFDRERKGALALWGRLVGEKLLPDADDGLRGPAKRGVRARRLNPRPVLCGLARGVGPLSNPAPS